MGGTVFQGLGYTNLLEGAWDQRYPTPLPPRGTKIAKKLCYPMSGIAVI